MDAPYLIQNRASRIEYLALYGSNVNTNDIFIFGSGLSGLGKATLCNQILDISRKKSLAGLMT